MTAEEAVKVLGASRLHKQACDDGVRHVLCAAPPVLNPAPMMPPPLLLQALSGVCLSVQETCWTWERIRWRRCWQPPHPHPRCCQVGGGASFGRVACREHWTGVAGLQEAQVAGLSAIHKKPNSAHSNLLTCVSPCGRCMGGL